MLEKYPRLVEAVVEFKRFSRKVLAEHKGNYNKLTSIIGVENYFEADDAHECSLAQGYRLKYNCEDDVYYCLKDGESSKALNLIINFSC
jgi:hypothetical protein